MMSMLADCRKMGIDVADLSRTVKVKEEARLRRKESVLGLLDDCVEFLYLSPKLTVMRDIFFGVAVGAGCGACTYFVTESVVAAAIVGIVMSVRGYASQAWGW